MNPKMREVSKLFIRRLFALSSLLALMILPASAVEAVPPEARFLSKLGLLRGTEEGLEPDAPLTQVNRTSKNGQ